MLTNEIYAERRSRQISTAIGLMTQAFSYRNASRSNRKGQYWIYGMPRFYLKWAGDCVTAAFANLADTSRLDITDTHFTDGGQ